MIYTAVLLLLAIAAIVVLSTRYRFNVFFVLLAVSVATGIGAGMDADKIIGLLKTGIGGTIEKIGLLIILGITLGILLEQSGATASLANAVLRRTGTARTPLAMSIVGYMVGLPIFCDSGFVVLSGLLRSLSARAPGKHLWLVIALASGLLAVHCLFPPHPGITAAAGILQVDIGKLMVMGAIIAILPTLTGYYLGKWYHNRHTLEVILKDESVLPFQKLPGASASFLPILIPILLIGLKSILALQPAVLTSFWWPVLKVAGDPIVALLVGIFLCIPLFRGLGKDRLNSMLESALTKSGNILLLTAAGGAFGEVIKALQIGEVFGPTLAGSGLGLLIPFLLAALFKTAQGSSTVAVISTAGILASMLPTLGFATDTDRALALLAMGAGSMVVSHTNDSYFWVVSKFSELETPVALKSYTVVTGAMGVAALVGVWVMRMVW